MGFLCSAQSAIAICDSHHRQPLKLRRFSFADLHAATNGFSPSTLLGKGSHGAVFLAVLDNGSLNAAVKKSTSSVTETAHNEIEILSSVRSRRIVNLIGFAVDSGKLLLVVEYMPNGSLYDLLHNHQQNPPGLLKRVRFALQVAKAVRTLHGSNPPVMHRDIKSSNVLTDDKGNARLGDFGLALRGHVEDVRAMSTPPAGTLGYLDPCYLAPGDLSTKSDVFSFGILLLEIISGRKAIDVNYSPPSIVEWALPLIKSGAYQGIFDRPMGGALDRTVVRELAVLAARCVRSTAEKRPHVSEVVDRLKMVYKRVKLQALPIWSNLRRRVERSRPLEELDGSDSTRHGSRRSVSNRNKKVSSVSSVEERNDRIGEERTRGSHRAVRSKSKSIGSFREVLKVGPEPEPEEEGVNGEEVNTVAKRRAQVTVKVPTVTVRLSKSRSMGVLQSRKNVIHHSNLVRDPQLKEMDVFPLLVKSTSRKSRSCKLETGSSSIL